MTAISRPLFLSTAHHHHRFDPKSPDRLQAALRGAVIRNDQTMARAVIALGAPLNRQDVGANDEHQDYHLVRAAYRGHNAMCRLFLESGANPDVSCRHGHTPMIIAASGRRNVTLIRDLLEFKANVNMADEDGRTAIIEACFFADEPVAETLLKAKADGNLADRKGQNALQETISSHCYEIFGGNNHHFFSSVIERLVQKSDLNHTNQKQETALMQAADRGYLHIVGSLLKARASLYPTNLKGQTARDITIARYEKSVDLLERRKQIVQILEQCEPKVTTLPTEKVSLCALISPVINNDLEGVRQKIAEGENVNQLKDLRTPLMWAIVKGHPEMVKLLLDAGANPFYAGPCGDSLELARYYRAETEMACASFAAIQKVLI